MTPPWSSQSQCNEHYGWLVALLVLLAGASWLRAIDRLSRVENQLPRPVSRCLMPTSLPPLPETGKVRAIRLLAWNTRQGGGPRRNRISFILSKS